MNKKNTVAALLAVTLLSNAAIPMTHAAAPANNSVVSSVYAAEPTPGSAEELGAKLEKLKGLVEGLGNIAGGLAGDQLGWLKELKKAFDFVSKLAGKSIAKLSSVRPKIIQRVDLLINVAETITADATELADSEQQAHVIIGFSVTRAMLKATDVFASQEELKQANSNLTAALAKAREIPKQTDDSVRTHYTLEKLDRALSNAKNLKNLEFRQKLDPSKLAEVDVAIRKAENVRRNRRATVAEVKNVTDELNKIVEDAYLSIPEGERTANNATKDQLAKDIQIAKNVRDFQLRGKVNSAVIAQLNREISLVTRVLNNNRSTVNQVVDADKTIVEATNVALKALEEATGKDEPAAEVEIPEEVVTPEDDEEEPDEVVDPEFNEETDSEESDSEESDAEEVEEADVEEEPAEIAE